MTRKTLTVAQCRAHLESAGCVVIIWQPCDLASFGITKVTEQVQALASCRKALVDQSIQHGWDVLECELGMQRLEPIDE